jgi:putative membrane protein
MNASELSVYLCLDDFILSLLTVQAPYEWGWRMHPMWGSGWGVGMMIMMALFCGAIIVAVILGMRWFVGQSKNSPGDSAMTILRERFARGEIEKDEFETKKRELS